MLVRNPVPCDDRVMSASNNEIWNAAELLTEWDAAGVRYKLFEVP